jgi:hypothetical protein
MSICLLCYAFPFYVSAITLARSELSLLICLVLMYLFLFFLLHIHHLPIYLYLRSFVSFFPLFFDVYSAPMQPGFPALGLCLRVTEVRIVHALLFPLYSLGRHSAKSSFTLHVVSFVSLFFLFFFLQAAKLNYVRFEDCFCFFISSFC